MQAIVFNIQRFCYSDGPGIRTAVFLKGCMLNCIWCHNPESKSPAPVISLAEQLCTGCGECLRTCAGHHLENGKHLIDRDACKACGRCADVCGGALELVGKSMTPEEILAEVMRDEPFYRTSGGGLTVTGGDPLYRPEFTLRLLQLAREKGLHTCVETSGFARWEKLAALIPYTDLFLWDVKETDPELHRQFTGVDNARILDNLRRLDEAGAQTILRCPIIPGCNDRPEHLAGIAALANSLRHVQRIDVEPYHPLGKNKSEAIIEHAVPKINALKENGAELIVMIIHWGAEYVDRPSDDLRSAAAALCEAGVDVLLGGHSHCVQPIEWITVDRGGVESKALVAYSLGNFFANQTGLEKPKTQYGMIVSVKAQRDADGLVRVSDAFYMPTYCYVRGGKGENYMRICYPGRFALDDSVNFDDYSDVFKNKNAMNTCNKAWDHVTSIVGSSIPAVASPSEYPQGFFGSN